VTSDLVERLDGPQPAKAVARLEVASRQVQHLTALVEGLLDFSNSSLGQPTLSLHELELVAMVQRVIARHQHQADAAGCSLQLVAGRAVTGTWDGPRLEQVFTNLITNSLSFGAGHPIEVTITDADDSARIAVRDHGIGIPASDLGRVFAKFERAVSSKHFGGLGLGLYVARQIVEAHGGTIDVASIVGEGATFAVNLPCHITTRATA
jgi:signal transduction histidine kinase